MKLNDRPEVLHWPHEVGVYEPRCSSETAALSPSSLLVSDQEMWGWGG